MFKKLLILPILGASLIAAKPAPPPAKPPLSLNPPAEIAADPANRWTLELSNGGKVVVQLRPDIAPGHVYRIQQLTTQGFYNGLIFHRVIPGFMAQGGDPQGTGQGGSKLPDLTAEFSDMPHVRGVTSMARAEANDSANSQFFIMLAPTFKLDHKYSAFGRVVEGMATVDAIAVGEPPAAPTRILRASIGGPLPAAPVIAAPAPAPPVEAEAPAPVAAPAAEGPTLTPATEAPVAVPAPVAATPEAPEAPVAPAPAPAPEQPVTETPEAVPAPAPETLAPAPEAPTPQ